MKYSDLKELIVNSLNADSETDGLPLILEQEGVRYEFSDSFHERLSQRLAQERNLSLNREEEFVSNLLFLFKRISLTGVAAIIVLAISLFMAGDGSLSLNSLIGLNDMGDESFFYLLTGN